MTPRSPRPTAQFRAPGSPLRRIRIETPRFLVRTVTAEDASEVWRAWYLDPEVMTPLNMPRRKLSLANLRELIAGYDQEHGLLLGVFSRDDGRQIGVYIIDLDHTHRLAIFNVIIGDKAFWGQKVINETRAALLDFLFDTVGVEKAVGMPTTRNFPAVFNYKAQGWRLEGTLQGHARALSAAGPRLDQYVFALSPEEWRAARKGAGEHG